MSELIKNTVKLVERLNEDIRQTLAAKKIDNTKEAANSLRIDVDEQRERVRSLGVFYIYFLDVGRKPGKFPPVDVIEEWARTKPVEANPYLVARKIAREGTEIYKNRSKGLELDKKRNRLQQEIREKAPKWAKEDVLIHIKAQTKRITGGV